MISGGQPGNLKQRIAALEQRNALSSSDRQSSPSIPGGTPGAVSNPTGLREKIAKFERKGGVPVPRGSFGLGAPPLGENAPPKRRGELYGNRITGLRAVSGMVGGRTASLLDAARVVSMPNLDTVGNGETDGEYLPSSPSSTSSPFPQFTGLTPQHTGTIGSITPQTTGSALTPQSTGSKELARATSFATALQLARKVEAESKDEASMRPAAVAHPTSPVPTTSDREENTAGTAAALMPLSIVPENQEKVDTAPAQPQVSSPQASDDQSLAAEPTTPPQPSTPSIVLSSSDEQAKPVVISPIVIPPAPDTTNTESKTHAKPTIDQSPSASSNPTESTLSQSTTNQGSASPVGPFSLANAAHDLGKVVENIQDMFPGQISPLAIPPSSRPVVINTPSTSKDPDTPTDTKISIPDVEPKLEAPSEVAPSEARSMCVPATSSVTKPTELLTSPRSGNARPVSMFATTPNHVSSHMTPTTRNTLLPGSQKSSVPYNHFPPTPEPQVSEFGTASIGHKSSHSLSHTPLSTEQGTHPGSFSAVVHKKVTELPSTATSSSSSYLSIYAEVSGPPKKSNEQEPLVSPGYGELATLLHEAALLEFSLEHGELPSDGSKKAGLEQNKEMESQSIKEEERKKQAAAKAKVEEEKKKYANVTETRTKQEVLESKSKSTFRNPLLKSKSAQKRDELADGERRNEPIRSKPALFRPLPEPPSLHSTHSAITPILEKEAAHPVNAALEADTKSPTQTSPRSLRYFASLKRFASSSKTSLTSNSQSRDSVSASSEVSSEDWSVVPIPAWNGAETETKGGLFNGTGTGWPVLSPKKSSGVGRSVSFTDKIFNRNRKTSKSSEVPSVGDTSSAYEAIDRLATSKVGKSAASLLPPLEPVSFTLDVPIIQENDQVLPSPPELASPRWSASLYVPSTSQFPPVLSARPTSSFYTSIPRLSEKSTSLDSVDEDKLPSPNFTSPTGYPQQSIDTIFSANPISSVYTPNSSGTPEVVVPTHTSSKNTTYKQQSQNLDAALFSVKPTSPVYTPHAPAIAMRSEETITDSPVLPSPGKEAGSPSSWMSNVSVDSLASSIPSPFFDSFPSVPQELPLSPALPGRQRNFAKKPSLPLQTASSFFEAAPVSSSAAVGADILGGSSLFAKNTTLKSATLPQTSGEHHRS